MAKKKGDNYGIEYKLVNEIYNSLTSQSSGNYFIREGSFIDGMSSTRYIGVYEKLYGEASVNFFGRNLKLPIALELGNDPVFAVELLGDIAGRAGKFNPITDQKFYFSDVDLPPQIIDVLNELNLKRTSNKRYYRD